MSKRVLEQPSALRSKPTLKAIQRKLYLTPNTNGQTQHIKKRVLKSTRFQLALLRGLALVFTLGLACRKPQSTISVTKFKLSIPTILLATTPKTLQSRCNRRRYYR